MTVLDNETSGKVGGKGLCRGVLGHSWLGGDTCDTSEIGGGQNEGKSWNSKLTPCLLPHGTGEFLVVHAGLSRGSGHLQQETFGWLTSKTAIRREGLTSQGMSALRNTPEHIAQAEWRPCALRGNQPSEILLVLNSDDFRPPRRLPHEENKNAGNQGTFEFEMADNFLK